jgi:hypothetical protein
MALRESLSGLFFRPARGGPDRKASQYRLNVFATYR